MGMIGLGCSVKSCTFSKMGIDGDPWNIGVPLVPQFVIPWFWKSLLHKRKSNRGLFTANNLNKVFYDVKKSNTLNLRQVANIRYYTGHSASL